MAKNTIESWFPGYYPDVNPLNCTNELDTCIFYILFGSREAYSRSVYWSLLSQQLKTDIKLADVKIFASTYQYSQAQEVLYPFGVDIIEVGDELVEHMNEERGFQHHSDCFAEFSIFDHPALSGYKYLIKIDADVFFVGRELDLYRRMKESDIATVGMASLPECDVRRMLKFHQEVLTEDRTPVVEYIRSYARSLQISDEEIAHRIDASKWRYGFFYICNLDFFDTASWKGLMEYCEKIKCMSVETVMLLYAHENINDLKLENCILAVAPEVGIIKAYMDRLVIVHPSYRGLADDRLMVWIIENIQTSTTTNLGFA